jgi:hypothetical protein
MTQWGIDALFNPGKRHMDEEKRRLQSTREEVGDSSGGKRIDLESGKVRLPGRKVAAGEDSDNPPPASAGPDQAGGEVAEREPAESEEAASDQAASDQAASDKAAS